MKLLTTTLLSLFCLGAFAKMSSNFTVTSDYVWRGQTQTGHDAAVQGGLDYELPYGFSLGAWASNAGSLGTESDFYGSYSYSFNRDASISLGYTFFHYTKSGTSDTGEINLGLTLWMFDVSANFIDHYFGANSSSAYYTIATSLPLSKKQGIALSLHTGLTTFNKEAVVGSTDYMDYKISLDRTVKGYTYSMFYTDTDRETTDGVTETATDDQSFGFSVGTSM